MRRFMNSRRSTRMVAGAVVLAILGTLAWSDDRRTSDAPIHAGAAAAAAGGEPFFGEIRMFAGNFAPRGWALCDGQILPISQNLALFSILGTTYGGDGRTTFGLPDLRGRAALHSGTGPGLTDRRLGQRLGAERVSLSVGQMPSHSHQLVAQPLKADSANPVGKVFAESEFRQFADPALTGTPTMARNAVTSVGGSQSHENMPPALVVNYIIALQGTFPSPN